MLLGKGSKVKKEKKLKKISFRYVRVAENFENLVFFLFSYFSTVFPATYREKKRKKKIVFTGCRYV